ncbi:MAG TPA: hypothetical protein VIT00_15805, partial [Terrimicrobiaceae bacterium]
SHIRIILTDEIEIKRREKGDAKKSKKSGPPKAATSKPAGKRAKDSQPQAEAAPAAQQSESKE